MKVALVFLALVGYVCAQGTYTGKYDNIDVDSILKSERLRNNYVKCLLDQGRCTPDGNELKRILPDALKSGCNKCNDKQKAASEKVIRFLVNDAPQTWEKLAKKYDPDNLYRAKFQNEARSHGINV